MTALFLGVIVYVFIIAISIYLRNKAISSIMQHRDNVDLSQFRTEKRCPVHNWRYDTNEKLYCSWCNKTPSQINNEP
jgi:hypothetical protein